jgi:hypothetical protein
MKLRVQLKGLNGIVQLDDRDIFASGLTLKMDARSMPYVVLEVPLLEVDADVEGATVVVPDETAAILRHLGWSAPVLQPVYEDTTYEEPVEEGSADENPSD